MQVVRGNATAEIRASRWFVEYLTRHLSVPVEMGTEPGTRFGCFWSYEGQRYGSLVRDRTVPAGLTPHVEALARYYGLPVHVTDLRQRPEDQLPLWSVSADWRAYQDRVHRQVVRHPVGIIDAPPRSGKTIMAARAIDTLNLRSVIVAPSVQIVRQTYDVMRKIFGDDFVSRIDGDAKGSQSDPERQIVVTTAPSAVKLPKEWWDRRDVLIVDEFHHSAAETYHQINMLAENIYYRYGFTGTHFRTGDDRLAMEAVCSFVLSKIEVPYLVENGWLAAPKVFFLPSDAKPRRTRRWDKTRLPDGSYEEVELSGGTVFREAYKRGIVDCEERNARVVKTATDLYENGIPTIVLTRQRKHAQELGDRIPGSVVVMGGKNALTSESIRDFLKGRHDVLVGTTVIGEGVDVPRAAALVYASGGSDGVQMMQSYFRPLTAAQDKTVGRIYDFVDSHHRMLARHSNERMAMARDQFGSDRVFDHSGR